jgi:hypothetical protein
MVSKNAQKSLILLTDHTDFYRTRCAILPDTAVNLTHGTIFIFLFAEPGQSALTARGGIA